MTNKQNKELLNITKKLLRIVKVEANFYKAHIKMAEEIINNCENQADNTKTVDLERDYFRMNKANKSEFEWVLKQLGIKSKEQINSIEIETNNWTVSKDYK